MAGVAALDDDARDAVQTPSPGKEDGVSADEDKAPSTPHVSTMRGELVDVEEARGDAAGDDEGDGPDDASGDETGDAAAVNTADLVTASLEDVEQKSRAMEEKVVKRLKAGHNGTNLTAEQMATLVRTLGEMHVFGPMPKGVKREKLWQDAFDDWSKAFPEKAQVVSNESLKQRVVKAMKVYEAIDMTAFGETGGTHYDAGEWQDALDAMAQLKADQDNNKSIAATNLNGKREKDAELVAAGASVMKKGRRATVPDTPSKTGERAPKESPLKDLSFTRPLADEEALLRVRFELQGQERALQRELAKEDRAYAEEKDKRAAEALKEKEKRDAELRREEREHELALARWPSCMQEQPTPTTLVLLILDLQRRLGR